MRSTNTPHMSHYVTLEQSKFAPHKQGFFAFSAHLRNDLNHSLIWLGYVYIRRDGVILMEDTACMKQNEEEIRLEAEAWIRTSAP